LSTSNRGSLCFHERNTTRGRGTANRWPKKAHRLWIRPYDLRHTCATLFLCSGENVKVVSERLGHASAALTLDVYSHVLPDMQQRAAERLEGLLSGGDRQ
jgi:integrase